MKKGRSGTGGTLRRFTQSYLLLLLVLLVMGVSVFLIAVNVVSTQNIEASLLVLEQAALRLDNALAEADSFAYTLSNLQSTCRLMLHTDTGDIHTLMDIKTAMKDVIPFSDNENLFAWYLVYFTNGDFMLEPTNAYLDVDRWYGAGYAYGDWTAREWRERVLQSPARSVVLPAAQAVNSKGAGPMLVYTKALTYLTRQMGKTVFFIDEARLRALFSSVFELSADYFVILGREGELLSASAGAPADFDPSALLNQAGDRSGYYYTQTDGRRTIVTYRTLSAHGWRVASATPYSAVLRRASQVLSPLLIGIAALLTVGGALALWSMQSNRKPLARTLEALSIGGEGDPVKQGLWQLDYAVHQLVSSRELLSRRLEEQRMELRATIVGSLESGDLLDEREIDAMLSHVGIVPDGDRFRGVYMTLPDDQELDTGALTRSDLRRALVMELLAPFAPRISFLSLKDRTCFILLYTQREDDPEELPEFFRALYNAMHAVREMEPVFTVGPAYGQLRYLPHSLQAARQRMPEGESSSFLIVAEECEDGPHGYRYTEQDEKKLISLVSLGKEEECLALLEDVRKRNESVSLSRQSRQLLFFRMVGTLSQAAEDAPVGDDLVFSLHRLELNPFFAMLKEQYALACRQSREKQTRHTAQLIADVLGYIEQNYTDYALSLTSVSMRFGITEKYLSSFIRDKAGINFSTYVERLRIEKANEYLAHSAMTMDEIAQKIGYLNGKTFCRAYGRVTGITPTDYRRKAR